MYGVHQLWWVDVDKLSCYFFLDFVARQQRFDVVMVDTAGRMQDDEPLMRALAKVGLMGTPLTYLSPSFLLSLLSLVNPYQCAGPGAVRW